MPRRPLAPLVLLLLAAAAPGAAAQGAAGVAGRVVAASGEAVPGANVTLRGAVERRVVTDEEGRWRAELPAGSYEVRVEHLAYVGSVTDVASPAADPVVVRLRPRVLPLGALVVTAGRRAQALADVAVTTELVSRSEIDASGAADVAAVLTEQTGIQLDGGHPSGAGLMLQGLDSERVLVLVDGQPFIGRMSGNVDVSRLPTSIVERVEVVKGPQATLYGSEAMGGVVNVVTRGRGLPGWGVSGAWTGGTQGRMDGSLQADGELAGTDVWLSFGGRREDLVPGRSGERGAMVARRDAALKLERSLGHGLALRLSGLLVDEAQEWQSGQLRQFADNLQWSGRAALAWRSGAHTLEPTVLVTTFDHLARRGTGAAPPPAATGERQVQRLAELEVLYGWAGDAVQVDAGVEASRELLRSASVRGGERTVAEVDPFVQATLDVAGVTLVPGARLSYSDAWGAHPTPRIALLARPLPGLAVRASAGTGYRAPGSKELFMEFLNTGPGFGYLVRGSEDLGPETSVNTSMGLEWSGARTYVRAQTFHNRYADFIETRALPDSSGLQVYTYGNIEDGLTRGLELEAGLLLPGVSLEAGWSRLDARDRGTGERLLGRPLRSGRLGAGLALPGGIDARLTAIHTGDTPLRRDEGGTHTRGAFTRFDARLARALSDGVSLAVGIDNVADATPADWPGHAGRRLYLTLRAGGRWGMPASP